MKQLLWMFAIFLGLSKCTFAISWNPFPPLLCIIGFYSYCSQDAQELTPPQLSIMPCGLNLTSGKDNASIDRTLLYFHYRYNQSVMEADANNTCMCLEGFSESENDDFHVEFYNNNCSLSTGTCPSNVDLPVTCHCNASSCTCSEGAHEKTQSEQDRERCSLSVSALELGTYTTHNSRTCYPTGGFREFPCADRRDDEDLCTDTYWVFCICEKNGEKGLCNCKAEADSELEETQDVKSPYSTPCGGSHNIPGRTTERAIEEPINEKPTGGDKNGFSKWSIAGVVLAVVVILIVIAVLLLFKRRHDTDNSSLKKRKDSIVSIDSDQSIRPEEKGGKFQNQAYEGSSKPVGQLGVPPESAAPSDNSGYGNLNILNTNERESTAYAEPDRGIIRSTPQIVDSLEEQAYAEPGEEGSRRTTGGNSDKQTNTYAKPYGGINHHPQPAKTTAMCPNAYEDVDMQNGGNDGYDVLASVSSISGEEAVTATAVTATNQPIPPSTSNVVAKPKSMLASSTQVEKKVCQSDSQDQHITTGSHEILDQEYGHLQATFVPSTEDSTYQKLERGLDVKIGEK